MLFVKITSHHKVIGSNKPKRSYSLICNNSKIKIIKVGSYINILDKLGFDFSTLSPEDRAVFKGLITEYSKDIARFNEPEVQKYFSELYSKRSLYFPDEDKNEALEGFIRYDIIEYLKSPELKQIIEGKYPGTVKVIDTEEQER